MLCELAECHPCFTIYHPPYLSTLAIPTAVCNTVFFRPLSFYPFSQSETIQVLATRDVLREMLLERMKVEISLTIFLFPKEI